MKRIQLAIAAVTAMFALTALASTAMATEKTKVLPAPTAGEPISATLSQPGAGKLLAVGGNEVSCSKAKGEAAFTSLNLGTGKLTFEGCTSSFSSTCTGVGDESGKILQEGTIHYLLALEMLTGVETTLVGAFVTLVKEFHFTCELLGQKQLVLVRGCVAGKDDSAEKLTKTVQVLYQQSSTGESKLLEILPPEATLEVKCLGETSVNGGAFTLSSIVAEGTAENWTKHEAGGKTKAVEVLLMNK